MNSNIIPLRVDQGSNLFINQFQVSNNHKSNNNLLLKLFHPNLYQQPKALCLLLPHQNSNNHLSLLEVPLVVIQEWVPISHVDVDLQKTEIPPAVWRNLIFRVPMHAFPKRSL